MDEQLRKKVAAMLLPTAPLTIEGVTLTYRVSDHSRMLLIVLLTETRVRIADDPAMQDATDECDRLIQVLNAPGALVEVRATQEIDPYRNQMYPTRTCDFCGQSYNGPAVYCSLKCALDDAS